MNCLTDRLIRDKEVAQMLGVSPGWVRKERHLRKYDKDHSFSIDPVWVSAGTPRYHLSDVTAWIDSLKSEG